MEMPQTLHDEAAYISESFGVPYTTALDITLANARRAARITKNASKSAPAEKAKKGGKRVDRR